jgi:N-acyl-D-aspartate/D-glutamate deacylase
MSADVVVRGGTIVDGTGEPGYAADVAIERGRIIEIGPKVDGNGARVLDASDQVVAPGFIDIHTHYDAQVFWDPALTPSSFHGVTTVVAGNCGFSIAPTRAEHHETIARTLENVEDMNVATLSAGIPWDFESFPEYLASVARHGSVLNFNAYVGHTALRLYVMGDDAYERVATPDEIATMCDLLRDAMRSGAAGFATSCIRTHRGVDGKPVPSRNASLVELDALAEAIGDTGRGVIAVAAAEPWDNAYLYELQPRIGIPITITALLASRGGAHKPLAELNEQGWRNGAEVWPQVTPRPLRFQYSFASPFILNLQQSFAELMAGGLEQRRVAYASPEWRRKMLDEYQSDRANFGSMWDTYEVGVSPAHPELEGRRVTELADERGILPLELMLDLALDEPDLGFRVNAVLTNDDEGEVAKLLRDEHCTLGLSDAGAHVSQLCDAPQATDLLGNWVRDRELMPLEQGVRKLTGVQADIFGFDDRGYLRQGACADVVVFDPDTIGPGPLRRVRDFPADAERLTADQPSGVTHVLVNGTPIRVDEKAVDIDEIGRPGAIVKPTRRS